jgi:hypothetical protein
MDQTLSIRVRAKVTRQGGRGSSDLGLDEIDDLSFQFDPAEAIDVNRW